MSDLPERACVLTLKIGGDTRADILAALNAVYDGVSDGRINSTCGGPAYGYTFEFTERDRPTHDEYVDTFHEPFGSVRTGVCNGCHRTSHVLSQKRGLCPDCAKAGDTVDENDELASSSATANSRASMP